MSIERRNHGRGHSYRVDGQKTPGVTTILGATLPKPALVNWAGDTTAGYAVDNWTDLGELPPSKRLERLKKARYEDRDAASNRGTEVHALAEKYIRGETIDIPDELDGHVKSYEQFVREWDVREVAVEFVVANRAVGYCGTVDLVADLADGHRWLLDLKTSRSGIFPEAALQACAYRNAEVYAVDTGAAGELVEHPMGDLAIERVGAVHIRGDGYELRPLSTDAAVWAYFRHLAWLHRHAADVEDLVGPALRAIPKRATA